MTTLATASSLREATSPEAITRARRRLLTGHPDPTRANASTPGSLTDDQLRVLAASDWVPPRITALDANTLTTADAITRALLSESVRETLERRLAAERPHGTYDDTRAGHDAFSRGVVDDYFDTDGASNGSTEAINGHYRAGQTNRQRLPQSHQLPTPNAPHRRRSRCLHPHSTLKSP